MMGSNKLLRFCLLKPLPLVSFLLWTIDSMKLLPKNLPVTILLATTVARTSGMIGIAGAVLVVVELEYERGLPKGWLG